MQLELSILALLGIAVLYGVTMKVADLLDEHGLKLFRGADILFGILWGVLGSVLILADQTLANVLLAQMIAYIVRQRLDYLNHALGATIMIIAFLATQEFEPFIFGIFAITFLLFGALRDYVGNVRGKRDLLYQINEPAWYYVIPPAIYSAVTGDWLIFGLLAAYRLSYNLVKYLVPRFVKLVS